MKLPNTIKFNGRTFKRPTKKYFRCWSAPSRERIYERLGHDCKSLSRETKPDYIELGECYLTDEGWCQTITTICFKSGTLTIATEGKDCDGKIANTIEYLYINGEWVEESASQRDYTAEAMGY